MLPVSRWLASYWTRSVSARLEGGHSPLIGTMQT